MELKVRPPPLVVNLEDGTTKSIYIDPIASVDGLVNMVVDSIVEDGNEKER